MCLCVLFFLTFVFFRFKYAKFLIAHMCARLIKIQIRSRLRARMAELKLAVDEPYRIAVTDYLNLVFGNSAASLDHWNNDIVAGLDQRFSLRPKNWNQFPRNLKGLHGWFLFICFLAIY